MNERVKFMLILRYNAIETMEMTVNIITAHTSWFQQGASSFLQLPVAWKYSPAECGTSPGVFVETFTGRHSLEMIGSDNWNENEWTFAHFIRILQV